MSPDAAVVHDQALVIDGSTVIELSAAHIDRIRRGGVTAVNHTVTEPYADTVQALHEINECRRWIDENSGDVTLALTVEDIRQAKNDGREAIVLGPQDTEMIGVDHELLGTFYDLGVRILQLTYQRQNLLGTGCQEAVDGGLTKAGKSFVTAMDDLGIVVDVSHCGEQTGLDAMEHSRNPILVTHSFSKTLSPHMRAKSDDFIKQLGASGGVMGITTLSQFLYYPGDEKRRPDLKRFVEHVSHVAELAGVESVAIATDYDETFTEAKRDEARLLFGPNLLGDWKWEDRRAIGMDDASKFPNLTAALLDGGFTEADVTKMLGENWLRVMERVWRG